MKDKMQVAENHKDEASTTDLCRWLGIARSTWYYKPKPGRRGAKPSQYTRKRNGENISNDQVVRIIKEDILGSSEFCVYGYRLCTEELKYMDLIINHKKVYRLMSENDLLLPKIRPDRTDKQYVKYRKIKNVQPLEHLCMDIKYVRIDKTGQMAYLLAIMDVCTRTVLDWSLALSMRHQRVILRLSNILERYPNRKITLRTDNGSQFIASGLQEYLEDKPVEHEFTHVATPEENAYVESLFASVQREVISRYEFESLHDARDVLRRYFEWYNTKRRNHALGRKSPLTYWNTVWYSHPCRPPFAPKAVTGQDLRRENQRDSQCGRVFSAQPEGPRPWPVTDFGLSLPPKDDKTVLN